LYLAWNLWAPQIWAVCGLIFRSINRYWWDQCISVHDLWAYEWEWHHAVGIYKLQIGTLFERLIHFWLKHFEIIPFVFVSKLKKLVEFFAIDVPNAVQCERTVLVCMRWAAVWTGAPCVRAQIPMCNVNIKQPLNN